MADNIVDIDFTNVAIDGETVIGTLAVDYTAGTVSGTLTAEFPAPIGNVPITDFSLTSNGGGWLLHCRHICAFARRQRDP